MSDVDYKKLRDNRRERAKTLTRGEEKKDIKKAFGEHDKQLHDGKKTRIKLRTGGKAEGEAAAKRLDKPVRGRFAKGGHTKSKKDAHTKVNVIVAPSPPVGQAPMPPRPPIGAGGPMASPPPRPMPPPGGAPSGGMPAPGAGGPPGMQPKPPGMMKRGGRYASGGKIDTKIKAPKMEDGAGGGKGRKEKAANYGPKPLWGGGKCK